MREQTLLIHRLQELAREQADRMFPECEHAVPMVIALPAGIHPYNRGSGGYFDPAANTVVLYQDLGRLAMRKPESTLTTIQHELVHWAQHHLLGYERASTVNVHRHRTWAEGCWLASTRLWPEAELERKEFNTRRRGGPCLHDVQLHHWPHSMPAYLRGRPAPE
jgi:hypothetical protein